jgi:hypothetical protein
MLVQRAGLGQLVNECVVHLSKYARAARRRQLLAFGTRRGKFFS